MIVNRRPGTDDESAARRQRAFDLFAAWLEQHDEPRELDEARFAELVEKHPDLREELRTLRDGLERFRSIRPSKLREALDARARPVRLRILTIRVAAAALIIAAGAIFWRSVRAPRPAPIVSAAPLAAAVVDRGVDWIDEMVQADGGIDSIIRNAVTGTALRSTPGNPSGGDESLGHLITEEVQGVAGAYSTLNEIAGAAGTAARADAAATLVRLRETLSTAVPGSWRRQLLQGIDAPKSESDPATPFLFALARDPAIQHELSRLADSPVPGEALAKIVAKLTRKAVLRVRAIDLDAGGTDVDGAVVFAQEVELPANVLGPRTRLGVTPLPPTALESGDWRITVVEAGDSEPRFSEIRVLANPGEDLGTRPMFLRATSDVTRAMALRDGCATRFGTPPAQKPTSYDLPETTRAVERLWIDPFEVTCAEYSEFFLAVASHPEWFDGGVPVRRPRVLAADGTCPPALARRPIVDVTWSEAVLYANWAGKRLPTELEWERVARGSDQENRRYPWGSDWDAARVNDSMSVFRRGLPSLTNYRGQPGILLPNRYDDLADEEVDSPKYVDGATPAGPEARVYRMADDVMEFVEDLFVEGMTTGSPSLTSHGIVVRVVKGSSWTYACEDHCKTWTRSPFATTLGAHYIGLRCVKTDAPKPGDR